jgi:hypothetical protein
MVTVDQVEQTAGAVTTDRIERVAIPIPAQTNGGAAPAVVPVSARTNGGAELAPAPLEGASQERSLRLAVKTPAPATLARVEPAPADPGQTIGEKILALGAQSCRWPLNDPQHPDFRFCGRPTVVQPYCEEHRRTAYMA